MAQNQVNAEVDLPDWVGACLPAPVRDGWRSLVARLDALARVGGPLEGWVFHGTTAEKSFRIEESGMLPTEAMVRSGDDMWFDEGSFWGRPLVAAGYAEDVERMNLELDEPLAIVATRISDLEEMCDLGVDEATLDFPEERLTRLSQEELSRRWSALEASLAPRAPTWSDSYEIVGSFVAFHESALGPEGLFLLRNSADLESLLLKHSIYESGLTVRPSP